MIDFAVLREQQRQIAARAVIEGSLAGVKRFVAVDVSAQSFHSGPNAQLYAAAVVLERGSKNPVEVATADIKPDVPYRTGFLAFREAPAVMRALERLKTGFDLVWVDGHGIMHPRRAGIATHLGVTLGVACLGVAKQPLTGTVGPLEAAAGSVAAVTAGANGDELLGFAARLRQRSRPVFVSSGHRCSSRAALDFVLEHSDGMKLPYPTRLAHNAANAFRRALEG